MKISPQQEFLRFRKNERVVYGAAALGRADTIGSLNTGKNGDAVILKYPSYHFIPYRVGINTVEKVIKKGELVYDDPLLKFNAV